MNLGDYCLNTSSILDNTYPNHAENTMIIHEVEIVLHKDYGGFRIDGEMAQWLFENAGWVLSDEYSTNMPPKHLYKYSDDYYCGQDVSSVSFRTQPELINCVRVLLEKHKATKNNYSNKPYIHNLVIEKVQIHLDIEEYHDGKEKISCWNS